MIRRLIIALCLLSLGSTAARTQGLEASCPEACTIPCPQLDDLDVTGRPTVTGACSKTVSEYRDSVLAADSLILRIWSVTDSCAGSRTCFQTIRLIPGNPRVAILPLENLAGSEDGARVLLRLLEDAVSQSVQVQLIPAGKVDDALLRGRIRQPYLMDDDQRVRLAAALHAHYFVVGSLLNYQVYQDQYSGPIPMISCTLQMQRATDGQTVWSESVHAVGNDGEWLFGMGVEHDITRLGRDMARRAVAEMARFVMPVSCPGSRP